MQFCRLLCRNSSKLLSACRTFAELLVGSELSSSTFSLQLTFLCLAESFCSLQTSSPLSDVFCRRQDRAHMLRGGLTHQISSTRRQVAPALLHVKRNTDKPFELSAEALSARKFARNTSPQTKHRIARSRKRNRKTSDDL